MIVSHSGNGRAALGKTLVESNLNRRAGVNVLALRRRGQRSVESGPISDAKLETGDVLIVLGNRKQLDALRQVT